MQQTANGDSNKQKIHVINRGPLHTQTMIQEDSEELCSKQVSRLLSSLIKLQSHLTTNTTTKATKTESRRCIRTIHQGWDGSLVVGVGEEDEFFVDEVIVGEVFRLRAVQVLLSGMIKEIQGYDVAIVYQHHMGERCLLCISDRQQQSQLQNAVPYRYCCRMREMNSAVMLSVSDQAMMGFTWGKQLLLYISNKQ